MNNCPFGLKSQNNAFQNLNKITLRSQISFKKLTYYKNTDNFFSIDTLSLCNLLKPVLWKLSLKNLLSGCYWTLETKVRQFFIKPSFALRTTVHQKNGSAPKTTERRLFPVAWCKVGGKSSTSQPVFLSSLSLQFILFLSLFSTLSFSFRWIFLKDLSPKSSRNLQTHQSFESGLPKKRDLPFSKKPKKSNNDRNKVHCFLGPLNRIKKKNHKKFYSKKKILQFGNVIASWTLSLYC